MPKIKTHRGVAKRMKITARGKVKRSRAFHSHLLSSKSPKRKRNLSKGALVHSTQARTIKSLMPYA